MSFIKLIFFHVFVVVFFNKEKQITKSSKRKKGKGDSSIGDSKVKKEVGNMFSAHSILII